MSFFDDLVKTFSSVDNIRQTLKAATTPAPTPAQIKAIDPALEKQLKTRGIVDPAGRAVVDTDYVKAELARKTTPAQSEDKAWREALAAQESKGSGDYKAVGTKPVQVKTYVNNKLQTVTDTALGKYQIMPVYHFSKIGLQWNSPADRQKFVNSPQLQEKLFDTIWEDNKKAAGGDYKKAVAAHYGGQVGARNYGTQAADISPQKGMPSVNQYVDQVEQKKAKPVTTDVITGLQKDTTVLKPGPTRVLAALPKDENVEFSLTKPEQLSPYVKAGVTTRKQPEVTPDKVKLSAIQKVLSEFSFDKTKEIFQSAAEERKLATDIAKGLVERGELTQKEVNDLLLGKDLGRPLTEKEQYLADFSKKKKEEVTNITMALSGEPIKELGEELAPKLKQVKQVFRTDKFVLNAEDEYKLNKIFKDSDLEMRSVKPTEQMIEEAKALDPYKVITSNKPITDAEVINLRSFISNKTKEMSALTKTGNVEAADIVADDIGQAVRRLTKGGTTAGRSVYAYKVLAQETMEPAFWLNRAQKILGDETELPKKIIDDINKFIEAKDIDNLAQYVANLERSTWLEKLATLRTAGLLTGIPKTDLKNITSNVVLKALDDIADTTFVRALDSLYSLFSKSRTTNVKLLDIMKSWGQFSTGAREGLDFLKTGISSGKFADKKIPYKQAFSKFSENPVERTLAKYTDLVFRRLEAEDKPFKAMGYTKALLDQANAAGKNARLKGKELEEFVDKMIKNPTKEMDVKAKEFARYITLQSDNIINNVWKTLYNKSLGFSASAKTAKFPNKVVKKIAEEVYSIPTLLMNLVSPFNRVATNLIIRPIEYSPAGFIKGLFGAFSGNQAMAVKATGRALLGTLIMGGIYELFQKNKVKFETPELDESKKETQLKYREQKSPYTSITIKGLDGKSYNYKFGGIDPLPKLFLAAGLIDKYSNGEIEGAEIFTKMIKAMADETYAKGISDILDMDIFGGYYSPKDYLENQAGSMVPTVIYNAAKMFDNNVKNVDGVTQKLMERIPVLRNRLPNRFDVYGNKMQYYKDPYLRAFNTLISPIEIRKVEINKIDRELERLFRKGYDVLPSEQAKYIRSAGEKIEYTPEELTRIQRQRGKNLWQEMSKLISSSEYQKAPDDKKEKMIRREYEDNLQFAKEKVIADIMLDKEMDETAKANFLLQTVPQVGKEYYRKHQSKVNLNKLTAEARKSLKSR